MYLNKALVYGNLARDPELRAIPSGTQVATFSMATNRVYKDKDGNKKEQTDWHNIVVFGKQAELVTQYLKKGSSALIEGRMQTRSWEQDGQKKYRTEIVADRVQFGPRAGTGGAGTGGAPTTAKGDEDSEPTPPTGPGIEYPEEDIDPDDIPF
jgi:single-strand DNA-binding protein